MEVCCEEIIKTVQRVDYIESDLKDVIPAFSLKIEDLTKEVQSYKTMLFGINSEISSFMRSYYKKMKEEKEEKEEREKEKRALASQIEIEDNKREKEFNKKLRLAVVTDYLDFAGNCNWGNNYLSLYNWFYNKTVMNQNTVIHGNP